MSSEKYLLEKVHRIEKSVSALNDELTAIKTSIQMLSEIAVGSHIPYFPVGDSHNERIEKLEAFLRAIDKAIDDEDIKLK